MSKRSSHASSSLDDFSWLNHFYEQMRNGSIDDEAISEDYEIEGLKTCLNKFLKESEASEGVILKLYSLWDDIVTSHIDGLCKIFDGTDTICWVLAGPDQLKRDRECAVLRCYFIHKSIVTRGMLRSKMDKWVKLRGFILETFLVKTSERLAELFLRCPHSRENLFLLNRHFEAKNFLGDCSLHIHLFNDDFEDIGVTLEKIDGFIPALRKLAIMDICDPDWNCFGEWNELLDENKSVFGVVARIPADDTLNKFTAELRYQRHSLWRRNAARNNHLLAGHLNIRCWDYFKKCTNFSCSNIETFEKPHKLRCTKCWYSHWCSPACKEFACEYTNQHQLICEDTIRAGKADYVKNQYENFISLKNGSHTGKTDAVSCNSCGNNGAPIKLFACKGCQKVFYCDRYCQEWDWVHGEHKKKCKTLKQL